MLPINKIILGTVQFGLSYGINNEIGKPSYETICRILDTAYDAGIRTLDTAGAYGDAIELIGKYHSTHKQRFAIINKFYVHAGHLNLKDSIQSALDVLGVTTFASYLFHSYTDFHQHDFLLKALLEEKREGKIDKLGVSVYTNNEFEIVLENPNIDLIQVPFNLLDNFNSRGILMQRAKDRGIIIHTRSVYLQGLFFRSFNLFPEQLKPLIPYIRELSKIARDANVSIGALAIRYTLANPFADGVLIGVDNPEQLQDNIEMLKVPLPDDVMEKVNNVSVKEKDLLNPVNWKKNSIV